MGSLLDVGSTGRHDRRPAASFGLVTELVEREATGARDGHRRVRGHRGVIRIGERATMCRIEQVPAVGDLIYADVPVIVEGVRIARSGRVTIFATQVPAPRV